MKNDSHLSDDRKRNVYVQFPELEKAVHDFLIDAEGKISRCDDLLVEKAKQIAHQLNIPKDKVLLSHG